MGKIDHDKAKRKFMEMKNHALVTPARYNKSGNDNVKVANKERNFMHEDDHFVIKLTKNNYRNNLLGYDTHILYFIKPRYCSSVHSATERGFLSRRQWGFFPREIPAIRRTTMFVVKIKPKVCS